MVCPSSHLTDAEGWRKGHHPLVCDTTWSWLGRQQNFSHRSRAQSCPGLLRVVFAQRFKWQPQASPQNLWSVLLFCSLPLALLMLVASPERLSGSLKSLGNRCQLAGLAPRVSISLTYLVTPFSYSLVTSHPCPQHCWTKVPPLPQGNWVRD